MFVRCGIGKVSAARCTQVLIDRFAPGAVINTGIAGGLASGLAVGDIVVADGLVQHDFDAAPIGFVPVFARERDVKRGGAVAQAASMSGVPFAVVRAISDLADGTAAASFEQFEQHAADASAAAVLQALALLD